MDNLKRALKFLILSALINIIIGVIFYYTKGVSEVKGYLTGTALSFLLSFLWVLGARKGMKSNTLVLLMITLGGLPLRLALLALFAFGGLYIIKMDSTYFAVSFLLGTIVSLIIEVWFFNTLNVSNN